MNYARHREKFKKYAKNLATLSGAKRAEFEKKILESEEVAVKEEPKTRGRKKKESLPGVISDELEENVDA